MKAFIAVCVLITLASAQETRSCQKYWTDLYIQGKASCNKYGFITGTLQGVDCFSTTMDGLPTCCNATCPLPDAPQPQEQFAWRLWNGKPSRPNFEIIRDPHFYWPALIIVGGTTWDVLTTKEGLEREHRGCPEGNPDVGPHPSMGRLIGINAAIEGTVLGMAFLSQKAIPAGKLDKAAKVAKWIPAAMAAYDFQLHARGAIGWYATCW